MYDFTSLNECMTTYLNNSIYIETALIYENQLIKQIDEQEEYYSKSAEFTYYISRMTLS
ncbi:hypothetical protein T10_3857 [Trichinella papuae]|uniref:Uncharacterized protein n=1 Tax=Trichinella papuae TaxID=268474 RepID=A0A0V1LWI0_9BILA|nr:hypothetical protein T10_3857 [Trichinella papuae]